ncbi:glycosyltransferase [Hydrogenimonas sp.]|nr:glycosyltransferase [Hydrogenimonas sp.]
MRRVYLEITPFFPTKESFRGPYIYDQVKAIERNSDFEVVVVKVVSAFSNEEAVYEYQGVKVYNFKVLDIPSSILPGLFHKINLMRFERFLKERVGLLPKQIAFIHSHVAYPAGAIGADFGRKHRIKNFIQHHGLDVMQLSNGRLLKGKAREWNNSFIKNRFLKSVNGTDLNIGVSQKVLDELQKIEGFSNSNTYVLYNGVNTKKFFKKEVEKDYRFTIGCIGNFWKIKDQITLLKALNILVNEKGIENIKVIFVGSGPTLEECKSYVQQKSLNNFVQFQNEIDHTELNDFYNSLDLFVLPSYYEALGCVYTEALQVGIPVIAVKGQGIEELIKNGDRDTFLIDKSDTIQMSKLIHNFFEKNSVPTISYKLDIDSFISTFVNEIKRV